jgi:hypothetical protein
MGKIAGRFNPRRIGLDKGGQLLFIVAKDHCLHDG